MNKTVKIALIAGGVVLVGGLIVYPSVVRVGMRKRLDEAYQNPYSQESVGGLDKLIALGVFDHQRIDSKTSKQTISRMQARERAKIIWDNYGRWFWENENESAIISAFNGLGHMDDVSLIAKEFYGLYGEQLITILEKALDQGDKAQYNLLIGKIINLPKD